VLELHKTFDLTHLQIFLQQPVLQFLQHILMNTIISCDYLNLPLADEHVGDVTMPTQVIKYNQHFLQGDKPKSDCSIQIKLNYIYIQISRFLLL